MSSIRRYQPLLLNRKERRAVRAAGRCFELGSSSAEAQRSAHATTIAELGFRDAACERKGRQNGRRAFTMRRAIVGVIEPLVSCALATLCLGLVAGSLSDRRRSRVRLG
jgi:hypothetical protein